MPSPPPAARTEALLQRASGLSRLEVHYLTFGEGDALPVYWSSESLALLARERKRAYGRTNAQLGVRMTQAGGTRLRTAPPLLTPVPTRDPGSGGGVAGAVPGDGLARHPGAAEGLRRAGRRPQGGGRRERRDAGLRRAPAGEPRRGRAVPAGQGGAAVGGARPRPSSPPSPRPPGGGRPAPHPVGQRSVPRVDERGVPSVLRPPAAGHEGRRRPQAAPRPRAAGLRRAVRRHPRQGPRPDRLPDRHLHLLRDRRALRRWRWWPSPGPTPTRSSGTTPRWSRR